MKGTEEPHMSAYHVGQDHINALISYAICEHPEWEGSLAKRFCSGLSDLAGTKIPGYNKALRDYTKPAGIRKYAPPETPNIQFEKTYARRPIFGG